MTSPEWADDKLSQDLPELRARGENQDLEFIAEFPTNTNELAKEIAAFSTSNAGLILLGVADNGDLVGLVDCADPSGRDRLVRRVEGITRGPVRPSVTPTVKFAVEKDRIVLALFIPKGTRGVYYVYNTPYLRHITESRPAQPHEVEDLYRRWFLSERPSPPDEDSSPLSELPGILMEALIYGEEALERSANPWLELWRSQYLQTATELRRLALAAEDGNSELAQDLTRTSEALEAVATLRLYLGCWEELSRLNAEALRRMRFVRDSYLAKVSLSDQSLDSIRQELPKTARELLSLVDRAATLIEQGRFEEFRAAVSEKGLTLLRLSYLDLDEIRPGLSQELQPIARSLHLVEVAHVYLDGGRSIEILVDSIRESTQALSDLTSTINR